MPLNYQPRRQNKVRLDGDCPKGVLAVYYHKTEPAAEKYTILYAEPITGTTRTDMWLMGVGVSEYGQGYHFEMEAYKMAAYRDRIRHHATKWSLLPEAVKNWVRADLKAMEESS